MRIEITYVQLPSKVQYILITMAKMPFHLLNVWRFLSLKKLLSIIFISILLPLSMLSLLKYQLLGTYIVPDTVVSNLHILPHLLFTIM